MSGQPVYIASLAMVPAMAAVLMPQGGGASPVLLGLAGAGGLWAMVSSLTGGLSLATGPGRLLRPAAPRMVGSMLSLPSPEVQKTLLAAAVAEGRGDGTPGTSSDKPARRGRLLQRMLGLWGHRSVESLSRGEVLELYALFRLLEADKALAGDLARLFHRPDAVLALRDQLDAYGGLSERCRQDLTLATTDLLWQAGQATGSLIGLESLCVDDPDLWHHVVLAHDATDPASRATALWCVRQPGCDRSTVAAYLSGIARTRALSAAARRGDHEFCEAIAVVLRQWRDEIYARDRIGLAPAEIGGGADADFARELDTLAEKTGAPRLPAPEGLSAHHAGRAPQPRPAWCPTTGLLISAPRPADYRPMQPAAA
ncbi:hypothetical protein [Allosediminivita pacifica]|uniref:Uncharacterized protein n=1 Tax=Allosediminivita pacifica TaxID=1267769 RepID=A0A2T6APK8_9RHOB|nr:hypothetical protein [Allosediminivita pacifica]PTX45745.1 hypothetical protein C8N44_120101 [Allosediminivita pacifica]